MNTPRFMFFLDYGVCFWPVDNDKVPEEILWLEAQEDVKMFLKEYHQSYNWGCPPEAGWTATDCKRFNQKLRCILDLITSELNGKVMICSWQDELMEDEGMLADFYSRPYEFIEERKANYYWSDDYL